MGNRQIKITQAIIEGGVTTHSITSHVIIKETGAPGKKYILEEAAKDLDRLLRSAKWELIDD